MKNAACPKRAGRVYWSINGRRPRLMAGAVSATAARRRGIVLVERPGHRGRLTTTLTTATNSTTKHDNTFFRNEAPGARVSGPTPGGALK